jgi:hypothetical protein
VDSLTRLGVGQLLPELDGLWCEDWDNLTYKHLPGLDHLCLHPIDQSRSQCQLKFKGWESSLQIFYERICKGWREGGCYELNWVPLKIHMLKS